MTPLTHVLQDCHHQLVVVKLVQGQLETVWLCLKFVVGTEDVRVSSVSRHSGLSPVS